MRCGNLSSFHLYCNVLNFIVAITPSMATLEYLEPLLYDNDFSTVGDAAVCW